MNRLGEENIPFFFAIDFEMRHPIVMPLNRIDPDILLYNFRGRTNQASAEPRSASHYLADFIPNPVFVSSMAYDRAFFHVQGEQNRGNSYLCNLTAPTLINDPLPADLRTLYWNSEAPYRLWIDLAGLDEHSIFCEPASGKICSEDGLREILVFSPEAFVRSVAGRLHTYPMKGTALVKPGDRRELLIEQLRKDPKELAEHITVVDLLRNDLGRICSNIVVERFRYPEGIHTPSGELLQISSRIAGSLPDDWRTRLGSLLAEMLPAGSVSGAPKKETCRIIREAESGLVEDSGLPPQLADRGYYTGVAGIFDGEELDSAVMIRFLEDRQIGGRRMRYFRSGGGITVDSRREDEYRELQAKVRIPSGSPGTLPEAAAAGAAHFSNESASLFETMLVLPGDSIPLLEEHLARMQKSWQALGAPVAAGRLQGETNIPPELPGPLQDTGAFRSFLLELIRRNYQSPVNHPLRFRLEYDPVRELLPVEIRIEPFLPRQIIKAARLELGSASYPLKFSDRSLFEKLHNRFPGFDEILITCGGWLTDGSFTSLYVKKADCPLPLCPRDALLIGTRRSHEITHGRMLPASIDCSKLRPRDRIGFMNALNPPGQLGELPWNEVVDLGAPDILHFRHDH